MKVLVVDDNQEYLEMLGESVTARGYVALLANDGKQAREFLEIEEVDAIISDIYMPTLDGLRFHSFVRDFMGLQHLPFVFVSGYADEETQKAVVESDLDFFFHKTVPVPNILALLDQFDKSKA
jgi:CheY-like chemotaxis protein